MARKVTRNEFGIVIEEADAPEAAAAAVPGAKPAPTTDEQIARAQAQGPPPGSLPVTGTIGLAVGAGKSLIDTALSTIASPTGASTARFDIPGTGASLGMMGVLPTKVYEAGEGAASDLRERFATPVGPDEMTGELGGQAAQIAAAGAGGVRAIGGAISRKLAARAAEKAAVAEGETASAVAAKAAEEALALVDDLSAELGKLKRSAPATAKANEAAQAALEAAQNKGGLRGRGAGRFVPKAVLETAQVARIKAEETAAKLAKTLDDLDDAKAAASKAKRAAQGRARAEKAAGGGTGTGTDAIGLIARLTPNATSILGGTLGKLTGIPGGLSLGMAAGREAGRVAVAGGQGLGERIAAKLAARGEANVVSGAARATTSAESLPTHMTTARRPATFTERRKVVREGHARTDLFEMLRAKGYSTAEARRLVAVAEMEAF